MKFAIIVVALACSATYVHGWIIGFWTNPNYQGKYEQFHSVLAENNCYNLVDTITNAGVGSFRYCTDGIHDCSITLHSEHSCLGNILASTDRNGGLAKSHSTKEKAVKSFRIQGCKALSIPVVGIPLPDIINIDACPK